MQLTKFIWFILNFDLMIDLLAARMIMRSKFLIKLFGILISWSKIRPPDQICQILKPNFDLMNKNNFDLMKKWISISWNSTSWSIPSKNCCYYIIIEVTSDILVLSIFLSNEALFLLGTSFIEYRDNFCLKLKHVGPTLNV